MILDSGFRLGSGVRVYRVAFKDVNSITIIREPYDLPHTHLMAKYCGLIESNTG